MSDKWNITDPVWGTISFSSEIEQDVKRIIESDLFQRLRYSSHLGLAQMVYPGATHTRFSHSIGAAYIADRMCTHVGLGQDEHLIVVLTMLLHDIGHAPFGHCFHRGLESLKGGVDPTSDKFWTKEIIRNHLGDCLNNSVTADILSTMENPKLKSIIDSDVDADRIDYLSRDSHFTGVPYKVDVDHLIHSMKIDDNGIYFKYSGMSALQGILFARKQMYNIVYKHPLVSAYEDCMTLIVNSCCKDEYRIESILVPEFFMKAKQDDLAIHELVPSFIKLSESDMWTFLKELSYQNTHQDLKESVRPRLRPSKALQSYFQRPII